MPSRYAATTWWIEVCVLNLFIRAPFAGGAAAAFMALLLPIPLLIDGLRCLILRYRFAVWLARRPLRLPPPGSG